MILSLWQFLWIFAKRPDVKPCCRCIFVIQFIFYLIPLPAQIVPQRNLVRGIVYDDSTRQQIPYAHIYNESKRTGSLSDEQGIFKIHADRGDTLVISAVGYLGYVIQLSEPSFDHEIEIRLIPRLYEIEAVRIKGFRDYTDFQRQFIALNLPRTEWQILRENLASLSLTQAREGAEQQKVRDALSPEPGRPLPNGIPILYRDDLLRLNYARVLELEKKQRVIDKKYNREIIAKITQLAEDEITEFMGFCNFSMAYLYRASEYEILVRIEEKFKEYLYYKEHGELYREQIFDWFYYT